jgi:hypothetical protein
VHRSGSESCPITDLCVSGVEPSESATSHPFNQSVSHTPRLLVSMHTRRGLHSQCSAI